jgi:hypothetical protein
MAEIAGEETGSILGTFYLGWPQTDSPDLHLSDNYNYSLELLYLPVVLI